MAEMISVREAAVRWNITERRVATLCKNGRIAGAEKQGNRWLIPADTQKSADQRLKTGAFRKTERAPKLPLPIGVSNYCLASSEYYYIDKTMIKDFIDERPMVTLFTRPRRFGKTLNMDMLRTYFEKSDKDTSVYFRDKKIWACGQKYRDYQGKYPVIFLTFKDVKFDTWEETFAAIRDIFAKETRRHKELLTQSVSSFDTAGENFYHGFMLGLCALLGGAFVTFNRESGDGRYDIQLKPTKKGLPGILIELKAEKNCNDEKLKKLSETALQQINDKKYETELTTAGVRTIYKYGVAFSGKKVEVAVG